MKGENIVALFHFLWYIFRNTQSGGARKKKNFLENIKISWAIDLVVFAKISETFFKDLDFFDFLEGFCGNCLSLLINSQDVVSEQAQMVYNSRRQALDSSAPFIM
ncbi:hypothetical protein T08_14635 [Trichinella sp. T8]|nr:hypothetical protein T08_14635 [Trichinella sp. T8]